MRYSLLLPLLLLFSCGRVNCITYTALYASFTGYDADSGVMVICTESSSSYSNRDTLYIVRNDLYRLEPDYNTGGQVLARAAIGMIENSNYDIYIPITGKRDKITGITYTHDDRKSQGLGEGGGHGNECDNVCTGYYLNGVYHATGLTAAVTYSGRYTSDVTLSK